MDDGITVAWLAEKMIGPIVGAAGLAALAWVRKVAARLRALADAAANAEAMESRFEKADAEREALREIVEHRIEACEHHGSRLGRLEGQLQEEGARVRAPTIPPGAAP